MKHWNKPEEKQEESTKEVIADEKLEPTIAAVPEAEPTIEPEEPKPVVFSKAKYYEELFKGGK